MNTHALRYFTPLALAAGLAACGHKADSATGDAGNTMTTVADDSANMTAATGAQDGMMAATPTAQQFSDMAAQSDAFEVAAGRLAATNANAAGVKAFGKKMVDAHTASTIKIKKAATAAAPAITPNATMTDDQTSQLAELGKLKGADFDKAYVAGQVTAHERALSLMKLYAEKGEAPTLKTAAGEIAPDVQDHLVMVRGLAIK